MAFLSWPTLVFNLIETVDFALNMKFTTACYMVPRWTTRNPPFVSTFSRCELGLAKYRVNGYSQSKSEVTISTQSADRERQVPVSPLRLGWLALVEFGYVAIAVLDQREV